jgi:hypothetical protein
MMRLGQELTAVLEKFDFSLRFVSELLNIIDAQNPVAYGECTPP